MLDDTGGMTSRRATVKTTSPLRVQLDGQTAQVLARTLASYTPAVNDRVAWLPLDLDHVLILGKIT